MQSRLMLTLVVLLTITCTTRSAPMNNKSERKEKSLNFYDYNIPQPQPIADEIVDYGSTLEEESDDYNFDYDQNDLSRTLPKRKKVRRPYNSPIYYIRLPPQPYMFVPGLGYVSQPPPPTSSMQQFLNVPVSFVSNGKPANIYQWSGIQQFAPPPPPPPPQPQPTVVSRPTSLHHPRPAKPSNADSTIHRLPGQFSFNGKPDDIFVLRDSYNSLYSDALQNFYP